MDFLITESQFSKLKSVLLEQENNEYSEECLKDEPTILGDFLGVDVQEEDMGPELTDSEILGMTPQNLKGQIGKFLSLIKGKSPEELRDGLKDLKSPVNEQQTPYIQRETTLNVFGDTIKVPTVAIHGFLVIAGIALLSKLSQSLFQGVSSSRGNRRRRLASRATGCQGGAARAKLVRMRRRRENWKRFLRKLNLR